MRGAPAQDTGDCASLNLKKARQSTRRILFDFRLQVFPWKGNKLMMNRLPLASLMQVCAFVLAGLACTAPIAARAAAPDQGPRVRGPIDESRRVVLAGNTRPEAIAKNDLGLVDDSLPLEHMQLMLKRSDARQQALDAYTESLTDKASPNFHRWLTPDELGTRYGVTQEDVDAVTGWLALHGLAVNVIYPNRVAIDFSGTAAQVREAFSTEIHAYEVKGVRHIANNRDPQIPEALAPVVAGIASMHDFRPRPMHKPKADYTFSQNGYIWWAVTPADLATIYNINPLFKAGYTGKGQTIVVLEDTYVYSTADWTTFRKTFGLSTYTSGSFEQVMPKPKSGTNNCGAPGINSDDGEAILDAEYSSAAAPNATIELAACANTDVTFGGLIALENLLNESATPPALVSMSYGDCEADNGAAANLSYLVAFQQAAAEGVSVFVSAGDEGAASCDVDNTNASHGIAISGLASTPYNVAVGGTDFADSYLNDNATYWNATNTTAYGSAKSYIPEIPWNDSCASTLLAKTENTSFITYGKTGFCNTPNGKDNFLTVTAGSGGPSACATGNATTFDVVSGTCKGYPKPGWQSLDGVPNDHVRDIPDVSLFAANGVWGHYYPYCYSDTANGGGPCTGTPDNWAGAGGGTSFSSPIMAGIQALVNEKTGKRQGNPNPVYYKIAKTEYGSKGDSAATCNSSLGKGVASSCVFYDVTLGDIDLNCTGTLNCYLDSATNGVLSTSNTSYAPAFETTKGWDFATGIGSVNAYNLVFSADW
jgi:subtilase family serine protease